MSISAAHSAAARQNGAQSHGPVTDEGKARSAQNARKHGLFGAIVVHNQEEAESYNSLLEAYTGEFKPTTIFEYRCVREMVNAEFRLHAIRTRMVILEANFIAETGDEVTTEEARANAFYRMASSGQTLSLALRYERHFQRQYEKAHRDLIESRRKSALDRQEIAKRADQAMAASLKAAMEAPLPNITGITHQNLQNEPNPTLRTQPPTPPDLNLFSRAHP